MHASLSDTGAQCFHGGGGGGSSPWRLLCACPGHREALLLLLRHHAGYYDSLVLRNYIGLISHLAPFYHTTRKRSHGLYLVFPLLLFKINCFIFKANPVPISADAWAVSERTRQENFSQGLAAALLQSGRNDWLPHGPAPRAHQPQDSSSHCTLRGGLWREGASRVRAAFPQLALSPTVTATPVRPGQAWSQASPLPRPTSLLCFPSLSCRHLASQEMTRPRCTPSGLAQEEALILT